MTTIDHTSAVEPSAAAVTTVRRAMHAPKTDEAASAAARSIARAARDSVRLAPEEFSWFAVCYGVDLLVTRGTDRLLVWYDER